MKKCNKKEREKPNSIPKSKCHSKTHFITDTPGPLLHDIKHHVVKSLLHLYYSAVESSLLIGSSSDSFDLINVGCQVYTYAHV